MTNLARMLIPRTLVHGALAVFALGALAGCSNLRATTMRAGRMYPSAPRGCPVRFENLTYQEANTKYDQVGLVMLTGTSETQPQDWSGDTRDRLWPKVCEIGGTVVTPNASGGGGSVMGMGTGTVQFAVWHEKSGATARM